MLARLCTTWHGWVSAAVYLPLDPQGYSTHVHAAVSQLDQLHADLDPGPPRLIESYCGHFGQLPGTLIIIIITIITTLSSS